MCFSEEKDSLSQWRAYGNVAKGVGFGAFLKNTYLFSFISSQYFLSFSV